MGGGEGGGEARDRLSTPFLTFLVLNLLEQVNGQVKGQQVTHAVDDHEGRRLLDPQALHGGEVMRPRRVDQVQDAQRAVCSRGRGTP